MVEITLHQRLDWDYGEHGDRMLEEVLRSGIDIHARENGETLLHVAARRRRLRALELLADHGAELDAENGNGKTAFCHASRRGFAEIASALTIRGASVVLAPADQFAVAVVQGRMDEARGMLDKTPEVIRTGNPGEDRLLADMAGRPHPDVVRFLVDAGADLSAPGLDDGTPLHQAAWFGQPTNARILIEAGAPLEVFDGCHQSSPLGWAIHGSQFSGDADGRTDMYVVLAKLFLEAGAKVTYPGSEDDAYLNRLRQDASPSVLEILNNWHPQ